jgi:NAD(P)-dependent dehydrogenase (short-subunit alcohol dehydrogenase family)
MESTTKIGLVTGGSRGLGKDMALALARKGLDVILTYHSQKEMAEAVVAEIVAMGRKAVALKLDVGDLHSFDRFLIDVGDALRNTFGKERFDFLIHNGGMGATVPFAQVTEEVFDHFLNVHFKGVFFLTQKAIAHMNDGGGIITISSGTTRFALPGYSVYSSMKGGLETLTRSFAKELGSRGIRANVVAPGPIETDFNGAAIRNNPQMKGFLAGNTALGRVGVAEDIGGVVAFLCSEDARWVNGQRIEVSGGINL